MARIVLAGAASANPMRGSLFAELSPLGAVAWFGPLLRDASRPRLLAGIYFRVERDLNNAYSIARFCIVRSGGTLPKLEDIRRPFRCRPTIAKKGAAGLGGDRPPASPVGEEAAPPGTQNGSAWIDDQIG